MIMTLLCGMYLGINTYTDLKNQEVSWPLGAACMAVGIIWHMLTNDIGIGRWITGVGFGILLACISYISNGAIGMGDALVVAVMGGMKGGETALITFCVGLILSSVYALGLFLRKVPDKKVRFPFVPFMMAAYIPQMISATIGMVIYGIIENINSIVHMVH